MTKQQPRRPQVFDADDPRVTPSEEAAAHEAADAEPHGETDARRKTERGGGERHAPDAEATAHEAAREEVANNGAADDGAMPVQARVPERPARFGFVSAFISAVLLLSSLAISLWFARFVSVAVGREDWVGWIAKGLAVFIAALVVLFILREIVGFLRLARLSRLRHEAEQALASRDIKGEKRAVGHLKALVSGRAEHRWALAAFRDQERHKTEPGALLALADTVLLSEADKEARRVIYESARRVAVVTAVVPLAFIAVLFVLFENVRMLRRLAGTYGGRPGLIGGWRLFMRVIFHIAATGAIALTDDLFGQFLGQDIMRRLSRRLGEGAFNGALTARLGIVAIELTRPCPYIEAKPLRARHVIAELFPEFSAGEMMGRMVGRKPREKAADPLD